jgi:beta-glucanase (GH16 family)
MKLIPTLVILLLPLLSFSQTNFSELVWSDEFNTNGAPNSAFWNYDIGQSGWGNSEVQNYTNASQNVRVENGSLIIDAIKNNGVWSSARLKTQGKKSFTYGRIVFRAKLPAGSGTWPALWLLGENISSVGWPACGEIDVMEHVGKNLGVVQSAIHTTSSSGNTQNVGSTTVDGVNTDFHLYELKWSTTKLEFLVDGNLYYTYNPPVKNSSTWPFTNPQFIIINIAMGGNLGSDPQYETSGQKNGIDPSLTQARMEVDYVRVYQEFTALRLEGSSIVQKSQTNVKFTTNNLENATYEWTVPNDAQIVSGQGTNEITVNWGATEGNVSIKVTLKGNEYEKSLQIINPIKPQGSIFNLTVPDFGIEWIDRDNVNQYTILKEGNDTRVNYNVTSPSTALGIEGTLYRPIDLTDHPVVFASIRSYNKSRSLNMRIDLIDENGVATNKTPVFNLFPVIDDGEPYIYSFNFNTQNFWLSTNEPVKKERITKLNLYIAFGALGKAGIDSLWIESIWVEDGTATPIVNRPSNLSGTITSNNVTLTWKDNATNETGFEIFQASIPNGNYTKISTLAANTTTHSLSLGSDLTRYSYRVRSFNTTSTSAFSNTIEPTIITSSETELQNMVQVFPNPNQGKFKIENSTIYPIQIRIRNITGQLIYKSVLYPNDHPSELDLSIASKGTYIIELNSRAESAFKKIFIY